MKVSDFKEVLRRDIGNNEITVDGKLPSLRELSLTYSVSVASAKRAIDQLQDEGVVVAVHGKGVFIGGSASARKREQTNMVGLATVNSSQMSLVSFLQEKWMKRGWLITHYNTVDDDQSPEAERRFLTCAEEQGFVGVALDPTPIDPVNRDFFRELRLKGMKILLLGEYHEEMSDENFMIRDFEHGGYLGVMAAAARGYRNVAFVRLSNNGLFIRRQFAGIQRACEEIGINFLGETIPDVWGDWSKEIPTDEKIKILSEQNQHLLKFVTDVPENTAILVDQSDLTELVKRFVGRAGRKIASDIGLCDLYGELSESYKTSSMTFDYDGWLNEAIDYLIDKRINPVDRFQRWIKPRFVNRGTMRDL